MYGDSQGLVTKRPREEIDERKLDPIVVAACVDMVMLIRLVLRFYETIASILQGDPNFWNSRNKEPMTQTFVRGFCLSIGNLVKWKVVGPANTMISMQERLFIKYFEVEKKGTNLNRAIANCKAMNEKFEWQIPFELASLDFVLRAILFFAAGFFCVLDLRHWFHQLTLPSDCTHLFSFFHKTRLYEWLTWPMGFKYTPVVAQTAVAACLREAGRVMGLTYATPFEITPAAVMVWKNSKGKIVVIAIVWYDNIFVNATSFACRERFMANVSRIFHMTRIQVKGELSRSTRRVEYLGVIYEIVDSEVRWQHTQANRTRWMELQEREAKTVGDWLKRLGIVNWHVQVRAIPWREVRDLFSAAYQCFGDNFDDVNREVQIPYGVSREVQRWLSEACADQTFVKAPKAFPSRRVFLATDASNWGAAGLLLSHEGSQILLKRKWSAFESQWHINIKETVAALETLREFKRLNPETHRIIVAVDNITAKAWMEGRALPGSPAELEVFKLITEFNDDCFEFVWVPSEKNPADQPSRNEEVSEELVSKCFMELNHQIGKRWFE